jgi:dihydrofolate synthase/folylpolyglutamate synthase
MYFIFYKSNRMNHSRLDTLLLDELFALRNYGGKMDLSATETLCTLLGEPHTKYPSIHVAGTNGKGTTCSILASALMEAGYTVGLYTSPHILRFNERIRVGTKEMKNAGGVEITDDEILRLAELLMPTVREIGGSFFEATTAMAFRHFADKGVDIAIIETGLGGRLDCTNVLRSEQLLLSVITSIDFDHQEYLGTTLEAIAGEKAGIIKPHVPVLVSEPRHELVELFRNVARRKDAPFHTSEEICEVCIEDFRKDFSMTLALDTATEQAIRFVSPVCGLHQAWNVRTAYAALQLVAERFPVSNEDFQHGLTHLKHNTGLQGRIELLAENPPVVLDVGHNPAGLMRLMETLEKCGYVGMGWNVVFAAMKEKDLAEMLSILRHFAHSVHAPQLRIDRARLATDIAHAAHGMGIPSHSYLSTAAAMEAVMDERKTSARATLIVGSFYLAEEVLQWWEQVVEEGESRKI